MYCNYTDILVMIIIQWDKNNVHRKMEEPTKKAVPVMCGSLNENAKIKRKITTGRSLCQ